MAGKRTATSDLNHENWDKEDDPEDAGTFQRADENSLKKRIIKTARRRNPISSVRDTEDSEKKSAFAGFTGFTKGAPLPTNNVFSFLTNMASKPEQTKVNGFSEKSQNSVVKVDNTLRSPEESYTRKPFPPGYQQKNQKSEDYYSKLKGLNESVSKWIKQHVDANPFISLQPIFRDYERYLKELENGKEAEENKSNEMQNKEEAVSSMSNFLFKPVETVPDSTTGKLQEDKNKSTSSASRTQFSFGSTLTSTATSTPSFAFGGSPAKGSFSFGVSTNATAPTTTSSGTFSFGSASTATIPSFSFSPSAPISFGAAPASNQSSTEEANKEEDAEDDESPKVEFTPVVEKDYLYSTRCKMFVKKEKEYSDRGVGNLFLKPIENSEKVQVILRADTNLGNLLCNFILSEGIPITRVGKKDVMLVCLPTPDSKPPPVPVLLRVKSPEEADTLFETFNKHKK